MDNSLFMEHFLYVVVIIAAIILFFFVVGIIVAIIFGAYTTSRDGVSFSTRLKCSFGFHQGAWLTYDCAGCYQSRSCMCCEITEQRERHKIPLSSNNHCTRCGAYFPYHGGGDD
jgi:hypothetical protein